MQDGINKFCPPPLTSRVSNNTPLITMVSKNTHPTHSYVLQNTASTLPQPRKMINNNTYKFSLFSVQFFSPMMKKENIEMAVKKTRKKWWTKRINEKRTKNKKMISKELFLFCFCLVMWRIKPSFIWHRIVKSQIQVSLQLFLSLYIWKMLFWSWIVAQYSKHQYYFIFKGNSGHEMIV